MHKDPRALVAGGIISMAVLAAALVLQAEHSWVLKLPSQWLAVAALPVLIGLVLGGYIERFSLAGFEFKAPPLKPVAYVPPGDGTAVDKTASTVHEDWTSAREQAYERTKKLSLVHIYKPSLLPNQRFDISIYLMRHVRGPDENQTTGFDDVQRAEFFFGESWGNRVFTAINNGGVVGVNTSAWGTFLAICRVTFNDGTAPVILQRYIDFEMAQVAGRGGS